VEGKKKKNFKKMGDSLTGVGIDLRPAVACRPRVNTCACQAITHFFEFFLFYKKEFLEVWEMGQGFWENGCTAPSFFEACPYTWKC
jgi:hypothetical protein